MTFEIATIRNVKQLCFSQKWIQLTTFVLTSLLASQAKGEFSLNFSSGDNVVSSWANQSCSDGGMMGGMGGGCSSPFRQELVNDNGTEYYHVIVGDENSDFALEFYMRTGGCCWWGGGGGMMGGGSTPYSSSDGDTSDRFANAYEPLAGPDTSGNGTGNPNRVYMRQITRDSQMDQEFLKAKEAMKPHIVQNISDGSTHLGFDVDMSNSDYTTFAAPAQFSNTMTLSRADGIGDFDMTTDAPQANITAAQFSYNEGSGHGGSAGDYSYAADGFDVYGVDWSSYCDPSQNSDHDCSFGGGMMGGMMGM